MIQLLVVILLIILIHREAPGFFPTVGIIIGAIVGLYVLFGVVMMLLEKGYQLNESHKIIETVRSNKITVIVVLGIVSMIYQIYTHSPQPIVEHLGIVVSHIIVFGGIIYYIRKKEDAGR